MKKMIFALAALLMMAVSAQAMGYEQARRQALFLTDKMAYELNLTDDQYEAAYEINLDYLMGVNVESDLYGIYWERRNLDLSYILFDWQYRAYLAASYFYRPLYWSAGYWHFGIYARYPHRDYFFFGRPHFYNVYRGGHSWHNNGGHSWYNGREFGRPRSGNDRGGMRDHFDRGDYGRGQSLGHSNSGNNRTFGNRNQNSGRNSATGQERNGFGNRNQNSGRNSATGQERNGFGNRNSGSHESVDGNHGNGGNNRFGRSGNGHGVRESSTRTTAPSATPTRPNSSPRSIGRRFGGTEGSGSSVVNSRPSSSSSSTVTRRPSTAAPSHSVSTPSRSVSTPSRSSSSSTSSRSVSPSRSSGSSFGGSRGGSSFGGSRSSAPSRSTGSSSGRSGGTSHFGGRR